MGHDVFFSRSDSGIETYAYHEGSGTKLDLERVECSSCQSSLFHTAGVRRRTALQARILHFRSWSTSRIMMVRIAIADHSNLTGACSAVESHEISSVGTCRQWNFWKSRCDLPDSRRWTVGRDQWSLEGERGPNEKSKRNVRSSSMQRRGRLCRMSRMLAKESVKFIDGVKPHVTMSIRNFIIWITPTWAERQRTEHRQFWWASSRRIVCKGTQHRWIVGKLVSDVIMSW